MTTQKFQNPIFFITFSSSLVYIGSCCGVKTVFKLSHHVVIFTWKTPPFVPKSCQNNAEIRKKIQKFSKPDFLTNAALEALHQVDDPPTQPYTVKTTEKTHGDLLRVFPKEKHSITWGFLTFIFLLLTEPQKNLTNDQNSNCSILVLPHRKIYFRLMWYRMSYLEYEIFTFSLFLRHYSRSFWAQIHRKSTFDRYVSKTAFLFP